MEKRVVALAVGGLVAVFSSLFIAFYFDPKMLGWKVIVAGVAELGFAALIAVFIIQTIDKHEKENYRREVVNSQNTLTEYGFSAYITGIDVPNSILRRFGQIIGGEGVIKRCHISEIRLEKRPEGADFQMNSEYIAYNASKYSTQFSIPLLAGSAISDAEIEIYRKNGTEWKIERERKISNPEIGSIENIQERHVHTISLEPGEEFKVISKFRGTKEKSDSHLNSNAINALKYKFVVRYRPDEFKLNARLSSNFEYDRDELQAQDGWKTLVLNQEAPLLCGSSAYVFWQPVSK